MYFRNVGSIHDRLLFAPNQDSPSGDERRSFEITKEDFVDKVLKGLVVTPLINGKMPLGVTARMPNAEITSNEKTSFGDILITNMSPLDRHTGRNKRAGVGIICRMANGRYKFAMNGAGKCSGGQLAGVVCRNGEGSYDAIYADSSAAKELEAWMKDERQPASSSGRKSVKVRGFNMPDPSIDGNYLIGRYGQFFKAAAQERSLEKAQLLGVVRVDGPDKDSQEIIAQKYLQYMVAVDKPKKMGPMFLQEFKVEVPLYMKTLYKMAQDAQAIVEKVLHQKEVVESVSGKYQKQIAKIRDEAEKQIADIETKMLADAQVKSAMQKLEDLESKLNDASEAYRETQAIATNVVPT